MATDRNREKTVFKRQTLGTHRHHEKHFNLRGDHSVQTLLQTLVTAVGEQRHLGGVGHRGNVALERLESSGKLGC